VEGQGLKEGDIIIGGGGKRLLPVRISRIVLRKRLEIKFEVE